MKGENVPHLSNSIMSFIWVLSELNWPDTCFCVYSVSMGTHKSSQAHLDAGETIKVCHTHTNLSCQCLRKSLSCLNSPPYHCLSLSHTHTSAHIKSEKCLPRVGYMSKLEEPCLAFFHLWRNTAGIEWSLVLQLKLEARISQEVIQHLYLWVKVQTNMLWRNGPKIRWLKSVLKPVPSYKDVKDLLLLCLIFFLNQTLDLYVMWRFDFSDRETYCKTNWSVLTLRYIKVAWNLVQYKQVIFPYFGKFTSNVVVHSGFGVLDSLYLYQLMFCITG